MYDANIIIAHVPEIRPCSVRLRPYREKYNTSMEALARRFSDS